jgi:hypothetical protein
MGTYNRHVDFLYIWCCADVHGIPLTSTPFKSVIVENGAIQLFELSFSMWHGTRNTPDEALMLSMLA